jgi:integrase
MSVYKRGRSGRTIPRKLESKTPGTWYYDFMIRGVRYKEAVPEARIRSQAERAEVAAKEDVYNDRYGLRKSPLFADFVSRVYLPWAEANKRGYARADAVHSKPLIDFFGKYKLAEITPLLIEKYKKQRRETLTIHGTERKPASVNREIACLSKVFSLAVDNDDAIANPCTKVRKLREDNKRNRYLTREEEERLILAMDESPSYLAPLVLLAIQTGMRKGELFKLEWRDVDFGRGTIYIRDAKHPTRSRDREIPMSATAREILEGLDQKGEKAFPFIDIKRSFRTALRKAGIQNFRFHDLRHTAATRWGEAGATSKEISELLGNSILVGDRYTHAIHPNMRRIVDAANQPQATIHEFHIKKEQA